MIIQMSNKEFQELRKFLISLRNSQVNKTFNEVFAKSPSGGVKGFVNPLNNDIVVEIPEYLTCEVEKVFIKYGDDIGKLIKANSITNTPKWITCLKNIFNDIKKAITYR